MHTPDTSSVSPDTIPNTDSEASAFAKLTDQLIESGDQARGVRVMDLTGQFLAIRKAQGGQEAVNSLYQRLRNVNIENLKEIRQVLTREELTALFLITGQVGVVPKDKVRSRRAFIAGCMATGLMGGGFLSKVGADKLSPISMEEVNAMQSQGITVEQAPPGSWTHAFQKATATTIQGVGWLAQAASIKKGLDAYLLATSGITTATIFKQGAGHSINNAALVINIKSALDNFLASVAKEHGMITNNEQPVISH